MMVVVINCGDGVFKCYVFSTILTWSFRRVLKNCDKMAMVESLQRSFFKI